MSSSEQFVAEILETSAVGYAGLSASLLFERHPGLAGRYEPDAFGAWKGQLQQWLLDLSAAVAAAEPKLFEVRMLWSRRAFLARQAPLEDLEAALEALRDTLGERLPEGSAATALPFVEGALGALAAPPADDATEGEGQPLERSALAYLEAILRGKPREALEQLLAAVDHGTPVKQVYLQVLIPAQGETGRMWHDGALTIGEEHVITTTTQRAMALLCERARPSALKNKTALLACVPGNIHDIGLRATADFFEMEGWQTINLGPDVPHDEIARSVQFFEADVVWLAATLDPHLKGVQRAIERIRALEDRDARIIVGGAAFLRVPELWRKVGADGFADRVEDAEPLARRLTES